MSFECGLCEVNLRCRKLIACCDESACPQRRKVAAAFDKPLSEVSYTDMVAYYDDEDDYDD